MIGMRLAPMLAPDDRGGGGTEPAQQEAQQAAKEPEATFTQAEVNQLVQKIRREEQNKAEKQISQARTEAEKLARMNEEEKAAHEREQREAALAERERQITVRELRATAAEQLTAKGLPLDLQEVLDYTDAEKCSASIAAIEKAFNAAVKRAVNDAMKGRAPETGANSEKAQEAAYLKNVRGAMGLK